METNVVIDATELFGAKKESGHIDLDSINDYLANGSETEQICHHVMIDVIDKLTNDYEVPLSTDEGLHEEMAFMNMVLEAIVDRQLGIDNPFSEDMFQYIKLLKMGFKEEE